MSFHLQDEIKVTQMLLRERREELARLKRRPPRTKQEDVVYVRLEQTMDRLKKARRKVEGGGMVSKNGYTYCRRSGMKLF